MIRKTIEEIELKIRQEGAINDTQREELSRLLGQLKTEIATLGGEYSEQAKSIADFARISANEVTRAQKNPQLINLSLKGLSASVEEFEKSHPRMVEIVNSICTTLSNLGI
jgi:hypothetical protein